LVFITPPTEQSSKLTSIAYFHVEEFSSRPAGGAPAQQLAQACGTVDPLLALLLRHLLAADYRWQWGAVAKSAAGHLGCEFVMVGLD
jgi:hypothetical protein